MRSPGELARLERWSIVRPSEPAFWVFVTLVAYGAVRVAGALSDLTVVATSGWALAVLLVSLYTLPAFVLVYELDLYEREPVPLVLGAFAWGAFAATGLSLDAGGWNEVFAAAVGTETAARWGAVVVAPLIEEGLKASGLVLLALIARDEIDDLMDGFVYGAVCGLGFAVIEDVVYFVAAFGGSVADMAEGFAARILASGLYGHVLYTGLVGMAIGSVVSRRNEVPAGRRFGVAAGLAILGVAGHALWNSPFLATLYPEPPIEGMAWARVVAVVGIRALPLVFVVAVAVTLARRRERRWLASALASPTHGDAITPEEASTLAVPGGRRRAISAMRRRAGRRAASLLARLQREQITLAMLVADHRVAPAAVEAQRSRCRSLRLALAAIPGTSM